MAIPARPALRSGQRHFRIGEISDALIRDGLANQQPFGNLLDRWPHADEFYPPDPLGACPHRGPRQGGEVLLDDQAVRVAAAQVGRQEVVGEHELVAAPIERPFAPLRARLCPRPGPRDEPGIPSRGAVARGVSVAIGGRDREWPHETPIAQHGRDGVAGLVIGGACWDVHSSIVAPSDEPTATVGGRSAIATVNMQRQPSPDRSTMPGATPRRGARPCAFRPPILQEPGTYLYAVRRGHLPRVSLPK